MKREEKTVRIQTHVMLLWLTGLLTLSAVADDRYGLVGPIEHKNLKVYLLTAADRVPATRQYEPLGDAISRGAATVKETGAVERLSIGNGSNVPVFGQAGDVVKGGQQDRVLATDIVVPPGSTVSVDTFCAEMGRWETRTGESGENFNLASTLVSGKGLRYAVRSQAGGQVDVWKQIAAEQKKLSANLKTDVCDKRSKTSYQLTRENAALGKAAADYRATFNILSNYPDAVGCAFLVNNEFRGADAYGSSDLFDKCWPRLLEAAITEAIADYQPPKDGDGSRLWMKPVCMGKSGFELGSTRLTKSLRSSITDYGPIRGVQTFDQSLAGVVHRTWDAEVKMLPKVIDVNGLQSLLGVGIDGSLLDSAIGNQP
jgi:hypothetical protein